MCISMIGIPVSYADVESIDPEYSKNLQVSTFWVYNYVSFLHSLKTSD